MALLRGRSVPTLALAGLLLAGCTADEVEPTPSPLPTETAAPTVTPSPTPTADAADGAATAPEPPAELERTDEVGAAAAAQYFVSLYTYTLHSGDVIAWDRMSHADCGFCRGIREDALSALERGEKFEGGGITLSNITVGPQDPSIGGYPVDASYSQTAEIHKTADGQILATTKENSGSVRIDTLSDESGWKILAVVVRSQ